MSRNPEAVADASGSSRRADMAPVPRSASTGRRINDLDRDVLLRVLSRLDAYQVVQTCVLSRKWRDLWRDVPRLHISALAFQVSVGEDDYDARDPLFKNFVNRLLMLRNPVALEEFHLAYIYDLDGEVPADSVEPNLWICHALLCNARSVEVTVWNDKLQLDIAALTSGSLTSLRLDSLVLGIGFFRQLQTGCRALERLILQDCCIEDTYISSTTLKFLSIGRECFFLHNQASISAPSLSHFGFYSIYFEGLPLLKNMESLETAYISLVRFDAGDIRQFLMGLSGVTTLDFYYEKSELEMPKNLKWCPPQS